VVIQRIRSPIPPVHHGQKVEEDHKSGARHFHEQRFKGDVTTEFRIAGTGPAIATEN
jgi:hypothetical protein